MTCRVEGCNNQSRVVGRGLCSKHYHRWQRHGDPLVTRTRPHSREQLSLDKEHRGITLFQLSAIEATSLAKRLENLSLPAPPSTCILWLGNVDRDGYGGWMSIRKGWRLRAHRAAFFLVYGWLPLLLRHSCDTPACIQPNHLLPGTIQDNHDDMVKRGRSLVGDRNSRRRFPDRYPIGERHHKAKLTVAEVVAIRQSTESHAALSRKYGVRDTTIHSIRTGKIWKSVPL